MKVGKPVRVPILTRVVEIGRAPHFHVAAMVGFPIDSPRALWNEMTFWAAVSKELGEIGVVDEGVSKSRGEVLVAGSFHAPGGAEVKASYARVSVGSVDKRVAVVGDRYWTGNTPTDPVPFKTMPIDWAHAFGGTTFDRNPSGKGAEMVFDAEGRPVQPLPNIEKYGSLTRSPSERPDPTGFGSMDVTFIQRRKRAGTYDKRWVDEHYPGMAPDMDPTFYNVGSPDQWIEGFFRGDESFVVENMHPERSRIEGKLPSLVTRSFVTLREEGGERFVELPMRCDTLWVFPSQLAAVVVFHGSIPIRSDDAGDVAHLLVACEELGSTPRTLEHYQAALARRLDKDQAVYAEFSDSDIMPPKESGVAPTLGSDFDVGRWTKSERLMEKNQRRGLERRLDEKRAELASIGLDPSTVVGPDPEEQYPEDPDALLQLLEEKKAAAVKRGAEVELERAEAVEKARAKYKEYGEDYDAVTAKAQADAAGPPKFKAKAHLEMLAAMNARARAARSPQVEYERQVADPAFRAQLEAQEAQLVESYRTSAHLRPTARAMTPDDAAMTRQLVAMAVEQGESLAGRDFTGADLSGMKLVGASFSDCFLESVNLSGADLTDARFERAVLAKADLRDAIFKRAKLSGANLGAADLTNAVFDEADLSSVTLTRANLEATCFSGADLREATWHEARLGQNDFSGANLTQGAFFRVTLSEGHFEGAILDRASFVECTLDDCSFAGAQLHKASFVGCSGPRVVFRGAKFSEGVVVHGSSLPSADFSDAELEKTNLRGTVLTNARFDRANARAADFSACDASAASFERTTLARAMMIRTNLDGASLRGANLMDALLSKARVAAADFTGANLFRADLSRVLGDRKTSFAEAIVTHVRFQPKAIPESGGAS